MTPPQGEVPPHRSCCASRVCVLEGFPENCACNCHFGGTPPTVPPDEPKQLPVDDRCASTHVDAPGAGDGTAVGSTSRPGPSQPDEPPDGPGCYGDHPLPDEPLDPEKEAQGWADIAKAAAARIYDLEARVADLEEQLTVALRDRDEARAQVRQLERRSSW